MVPAVTARVSSWCLPGVVSPPPLGPAASRGALEVLWAGLLEALGGAEDPGVPPGDVDPSTPLPPLLPPPLLLPPLLPPPLLPPLLPPPLLLSLAVGVTLALGVVLAPKLELALGLSLVLGLELRETLALGLPEADGG